MQSGISFSQPTRDSNFVFANLQAALDVIPIEQQDSSEPHHVMLESVIHDECDESVEMYNSGTSANGKLTPIQIPRLNIKTLIVPL